MKDIYYHYYKYIDGKSKKAWKKLIKWLKKHPEFTGEIFVYTWAAKDGSVDITIKSSDKEIK